MDQIIGSGQIPGPSRIHEFEPIVRKFHARPVPVEKYAADGTEPCAQLAQLGLVIGDVGGPIRSVGGMSPVDQRIIEVQGDPAFPQGRGQFGQYVPLENRVGSAKVFFEKL